jgi:Ca2+/Na+ antiporter
MQSKTKYYLRCVFHGFGIGVIITSVLNQFMIFLDILRFGRTMLTEPNIYILSAEILLYGLGLVYIVWFFKRYIIQRKILEE